MIDPLLYTLGAALLLASGIGTAWLRPRLVVSHPWLVLGLLALVSLAAAAELVRLDPLGFTIDVDPASEPLIRRNDPGIPIYRQAIRDFGNDDVYVIAMETDDVFRRENLEAIQRLTRGLRRLPGIAGVESLAHVLSVEYDAERDMVSLDDFMKEVPSDPDARAELKRRALANPVYRKTLVSADARATALNITFQPMTDADFVDLDLDGRIEALLASERAPGRDFFVAGRPHVRSQAYHMMVGDMARLVPIAVAVAAFTLWLMSGSIWGVVIPLFSCLTATLWVFGSMAGLGIDINLITLVLASMMICVGSVYGIHVYARYDLIAGRTADRSAAALECLVYSRTPVLMAGFTTCIGFGALLLAEIPATNELGAFAVLGVASVTMISLTGVPAALALLPERSELMSERIGSKGISAAFLTSLRALLDTISRISIRHPNLALGFWGVACVGALLSIPQISVDTDVITFFKEDSEVRTDFAAVNRLITGAVPIYLTISGTTEGDFRDPETLRMLKTLQQQLEGVPGVRQALSSVDLIELTNRAIKGGDPAEARIPDTRGGLAEATFMLPKSLLRRFSNSNHSRGNLIVRTGRAGSAAIRDLEASIRTVLAKAELPPGFSTEVTGNVILLNRSADGIAGSQLSQVGFAAGTIFALISLVFRSLRIALISMIPNIVPVLVFFGILGAGVAKLSLPTGLIGSIALGIAIDDTMHFLVAYRSQRSRGLDPEAAAYRCIHDVGTPIVMTSVMLVVGFLVILASGFATLQEFGYLTAMTMAICLATDLILLPALLVRFEA